MSNDQIGRFIAVLICLPIVFILVGALVGVTVRVWEWAL
jgi:hypothetical protein